MITIKLSKINDYHLLYECMAEEQNAGQEIMLDLSSHKFINPYQVIILVLFVIRQINKGCTIRIIQPSHVAVEKYLSDIGLFEFCQTNQNSSNTVQQIVSSTAMPIKRITTESMNEYIEMTVAYFRHLCDDKDLTMLNIAIAELINNVYDHAQSLIDAYVFCQFFPDTHTIKLVVGDLGIGIPYAVNSFLKKESLPELTAAETIEWALKENQSTFSQPHNKGKGFNNLLTFIDTNQGILNIFTNEVHYNFSGEGSVKANPIHNFNGTIVEIEIKVNNLPFLEESEKLEEIW